jgi:hypothetical protein
MLSLMPGGVRVRGLSRMSNKSNAHKIKINFLL